MSKEIYTKFKKIDEGSFSIERKVVSENITTMNMTIKELQAQKNSKLKAKQTTLDHSARTVGVLNLQIAEIDKLIELAGTKGVS